MTQKGMQEFDSKAWRAFHKIGQQLLPHLSRQINSHSGITSAEYVVLLAIYEADRSVLNLNTLANHLGWEMSRMSHQATRMSESGLISKEKNSLDSRCFDFSMTKKGQKIIEAAIPRHSLEINHCFSNILTKTQMQALIEISDVISEHLETQHPVLQKKTFQKVN